MTGIRLVMVLSFILGMMCGAAAYAYYAHQPSMVAARMQTSLTGNSQTTEPNIPTPSAEANIDIIGDEASLADQVMANTQRWRSHAKELISLRERLVLLENTISGVQDSTSAARDLDEQPPLPGSEMMSKSALVASGVRDDVAADIVYRHSRMEMQRLELRDRATRENWIGSDRYTQALQELSEGEVELREEIGDDAYDRLLYSTGQSNRIVVTSIIQNSPAAQAGVLDGDVILSYGGDRVFSWSDLSSATTQGQRGDYVSLLLQRGDEAIDLSIPRGPLGVKLDTARRNPEEDSS